MKDFCQLQNYKTLLREMKDLNRWRNRSCTWISIISYKVFNFPQILIDIDKISVKFTANGKGCGLDKKEEQSWRAYST